MPCHRHRSAETVWMARTLKDAHSACKHAACRLSLAGIRRAAIVRWSGTGARDTMVDGEMTAADGLPGAELEPRERIARPSLHEAIVTRVRDMIIEGDLAPGTRIHEGQLGSKLGVSRT